MENIKGKNIFERYKRLHSGTNASTESKTSSYATTATTVTRDQTHGSLDIMTHTSNNEKYMNDRYTASPRKSGIPATISPSRRSMNKPAQEETHVSHQNGSPMSETDRVLNQQIEKAMIVSEKPMNSSSHLDASKLEHLSLSQLLSVYQEAQTSIQRLHSEIERAESELETETEASQRRVEQEYSNALHKHNDLEDFHAAQLSKLATMAQMVQRRDYDSLQAALKNARNDETQYMMSYPSPTESEIGSNSASSILSDHIDSEHKLERSRQMRRKSPGSSVRRGRGLHSPSRMSDSTKKPANIDKAIADLISSMKFKEKQIRDQRLTLKELDSSAIERSWQLARPTRGLSHRIQTTPQSTMGAPKLGATGRQSDIHSSQANLSPTIGESHSRSLMQQPNSSDIATNNTSDAPRLHVPRLQAANPVANNVSAVHMGSNTNATMNSSSTYQPSFQQNGASSFSSPLRFPPSSLTSFTTNGNLTSSTSVTSEPTSTMTSLPGTSSVTPLAATSSATRLATGALQDTTDNSGRVPSIREMLAEAMSRVRAAKNVSKQNSLNQNASDLHFQ